MGDEDSGFLGGPTFLEVVNPHLSIQSAITAIHHTHKSKFQMIQVIDTVPWGKCLLLDGHMQSSEKDEFVYHECLVHPVMINHPNPKRIFVGGGGEGATIREVLRHNTVEKVVMVDIDGECVEVCRKFLPQHHRGYLDKADPRVELIIDDAKVYLERTTEKFDVIIMDLSDPLEGGPAALLYTQKFYEMCVTKLNPGGIVATQAGPSGLLTYNLVYSAIHKTMQQVFPSVRASGVFIPSYADTWGYCVGYSVKDFDPTTLTTEEVDKRLAKLKDAHELKFLDGISYKGLFILPKSMREGMIKEDRIITEDTPLVIP